MNPLEIIKFNKLISLELSRDLIKHLKRGHRWVFKDSINIPSGAKNSSGIALLKRKGEPVAYGIYQGETDLTFRSWGTIPSTKKGIEFSEIQRNVDERFAKALSHRTSFLSKNNNSVRLINGEGDGLPGLTIDLYDTTAVIKHDQEFLENIYHHENIAKYLLAIFPQIVNVYLKRRNNETYSDGKKGHVIIGQTPTQVCIIENGMKFHSNIVDAAKTGFFLDQRDNRFLISKLSNKLKVLNLFSYTGGFSIAAACGGAVSVTSVDISTPAIKQCSENFKLNKFSHLEDHEEMAVDAFEFIKTATIQKRKWDLVIVDPPSFAPNKDALENAKNSYLKLFTDAIKLTHGKNGLMAFSSCSSHLTADDFLSIVQNAISANSREGRVLYSGGQPFDHPYGLYMQELKYLKFILLEIN